METSQRWQWPGRDWGTRGKGRESEDEVGSALEGPIRWRVCSWRVAHLPHQGHAPPPSTTPLSPLQPHTASPLPRPPCRPTQPAPCLVPLPPHVASPLPLSPHVVSSPSPITASGLTPSIFLSPCFHQHHVFGTHARPVYPLPRSSGFCHAPLTISHAV
ncbi:hypothetical protein Pcinc_026931 [Petrolisthes cinctipes]|uniref:Uncharacterized protein n=1 Tax=Petrolisthes cinctipes TaxID=88211 RepID=A0AAE1K7G4_PETCI|nr:hypothetical protein Pcinc_026931 [Petrolisthes cinctipes]